MNFFLRNKRKNIHKASKILKNPSTGNIKFVSVRNLKTVSNLLKPIIQSNIIIQELTIVEKLKTYIE